MDLSRLGHVKSEIYVLDVDDINIVILLINEYKASFEVLVFMKRLQFLRLDHSEHIASSIVYQFEKPIRGSWFILKIIVRIY